MENRCLRLLLATLFLICFFYSKAQTYQWAKGMTPNLGGQTVDMIVDSYGRSISTGYFSGTGDFDPGTGTFTMSSALLEDVFVLRLDENGAFVWAKRVGGTGTDKPIAMAFDNVGNMYICGQYQSVVDFDPGTGVHNLDAGSSGGYRYFVLKLSYAGDFVSVVDFANIINGMDVDASGNVLLTGSFFGSAQFGSQTITGQSSTCYVVKLNSNLSVTWARAMGGPGSQDQGLAIDIDKSGNVYTAGLFNQTADFDPGAGTSTLDAGTGKAFFISKLNSSGNYVWAQPITEVAGLSPEISNIIADDSGRVFFCGNFSGTVDFDPGTGVANLTGPTSTTGFMACWSAAGTYNWAGRFAGTGTVKPYDLTLDRLGRVYMAGTFYATADFDPGPGVASYNATTTNLFVVKLNQFGTFQMAFAIRNNSSNAANTIAVDYSQNVFIGGSYLSTTDFDPSTNTAYLGGSSSVTLPFLAKYSTCTVPPKPSNPVCPSNACFGQTYTITTPAVAGATAYDWTLPTGTSITGPSTGNSIQLYVSNSANTGNNYIIVAAINDCGVGLPSNPGYFNGVYPPTLSITSTAVHDSICEGYGVTLTASGANSYSWNNGVQNGSVFYPTSTQTYTVTGTTTGCTSTKSRIVYVKPKPILSIQSTPGISLCQGTPLTLTASGAATYTWTGGVINGQPFVPTQSQTYSVSGVSSEGCPSLNPSSVSVAITLTFPPTIINQPMNQNVASGADVVFTATFQDPATLLFQWQKDEGSGFQNISNVAPYSNATTTALNISGVSVAMDGFQYRCIAFHSGCSDTTNPAILNVATSSIVNYYRPELQVFPNPAKESIHLKGITSGSVEIYSIEGKKVHDQSLFGSDVVSLSDLQPGMYWLEVNGSRYRFIKEE